MNEQAKSSFLLSYLLRCRITGSRWSVSTWLTYDQATVPLIGCMAQTRALLLVDTISLRRFLGQKHRCRAKIRAAVCHGDWSRCRSRGKEATRCGCFVCRRRVGTDRHGEASFFSFCPANRQFERNLGWGSKAHLSLESCFQLNTGLRAELFTRTNLASCAVLPFLWSLM